MSECRRCNCITEIGTQNFHGRIILNFAIPHSLEQVGAELDDEEQTAAAERLSKSLLARTRDVFTEPPLETISEDIDTAFGVSGLGKVLLPFMWEFGEKMGDGDPNQALAYIACAACQLTTYESMGVVVVDLPD